MLNTCHGTKNEALYLTGYSGRNVPLQDFSTSPQDYFQAHAVGTSYDMDAFISRFNLQTIGVGIDEQLVFAGKGLLLYPNPAQTMLNIAIDGLENEKLTISIYDVSGKLIQSNTVYNQPIVSLDINTFTSGIYFVQVVGKNNVKNAKFIKE